MNKRKRVIDVKKLYTPIKSRRLSLRGTRGVTGVPGVEVENDDALLEVPSDVWVCVEILRKEFIQESVTREIRTPRKKRRPLLPFPVILKSQLYSVLINLTEVDRTLEKLQQEYKIKMFKILSLKDEYLVMVTEDYINVIRAQSEKYKKNKAISASPLSKGKEKISTEQGDDKGKGKSKAQRIFSDEEDEKEENLSTELDLFEIFIQKVVLQHPNCFIGDDALLSLFPYSKEQNETLISELINYGLLIHTRDDNMGYCLSIPNCGNLVASVLRGRAELLNLVKRQKHQEILKEDLCQKNLRSSELSVRFHLRDLIGQKRFESIETTAGPLIRFVK